MHNILEPESMSVSVLVVFLASIEENLIEQKFSKFY